MAPKKGDDTKHDEYLKGIKHDGLRAVLAGVADRDPDQQEFLSAVHEVAKSLEPVFEKKPELLKALEVLCEPERQITFRVPWIDDKGEVQVNRGFRVQFSSALGPYKGGLRFREGVNLSIIKFLGFEQTFKNAITSLPMGSAKGGSDFEPKGKSSSEVQRFCQSFMTELHKYIGDRRDTPAGDIGVGPTEIGYLFGQYKRIAGVWNAALTGKGMGFGGSFIRPEATGYGVVFFAEAALKDRDDDLKDKRCVVSGSGNVASYCAMMLLRKGAKVLALSDSKGYVYVEDGLTEDQLKQVLEIKSNHNGSLEDFDGGKYVGDRAKPWEIDTEVDMAFPCATQNEVDEEDAKQLTQHGCKFLFEGANMPCTSSAVEHFEKEGVLYAPGKASNAGGVAVSWLEMVQNRSGLSWEEEEVESKLEEIMKGVYESAKSAAEEYDTNLAAGANIAGFLKVADAVMAEGAV